VPFLRLSRDQRGYENTFLLHAAYPGARPRVLYWYRSAPAVRVGRRALDEDAIRAIEEQHPEIEFDWPHILEDANALPPEVERRQERPRRKPQRSREQEAAPSRAEIRIPAREAEPEPQLETEAVSAPEPQVEQESRRQIFEPSLSEPRPRNPLLDELVGREIAARLRLRFADIQSRISRSLADAGTRSTWQTRADALDPDRWTTPVAILDGVQRADALVDELRREISVTE
jgi:hypothetical protein